MENYIFNNDIFNIITICYEIFQLILLGTNKSEH